MFSMFQAAPLGSQLVAHRVISRNAAILCNSSNNGQVQAAEKVAVPNGCTPNLF
jgi:hypothetical protein